MVGIQSKNKDNILTKITTDNKEPWPAEGK